MYEPDSARPAIRALPEAVVRAIAAGETIDSLAAAVRELAENAIDAGATRITVALRSDRWEVCITDNGAGMTAGELARAARPHTTSKIRDRDDLRRIATLGFRGEALYSLACLGELEIRSQADRDAQAGEGCAIRFDRDGQPHDRQPVAIAPGTIVTVRDLFADLPGRREALPSLVQQRAWARQAIANIALCHPGVTWKILWNDRHWQAIAAGDCAADILAQLSPTVRRDDLAVRREPIDLPNSPNLPDLPDSPNSPNSPDAPELSARKSPTIEIALGLPDRCHRRRPDWIHFAVNGRVVSLPDLERSLLRATARTLPRGRYPVCFVHLRLPPDRVDWNRNPAKSEIYLHDLEALQTQLEGAIDRTFQLDGRLDAPAPDRVNKLLSVAEASAAYTVRSRAISPETPDISETPDTSDTRDTPDRRAPARDSSAPSPLPNGLRATGQVNDTYIVAEHASGLWLIEQHIAHERVLYERLQDRWQLATLEPPAIVDDLRPQQVENLRAIGIEVEPFGDSSWAVRHIPEILRDATISRDLDISPNPHDANAIDPLDVRDAIVELSQGDLEAAIVASACRSAIRNGTPLDRDRQQTLLDNWQRTRHPHTCPHGRPIYLSLSESSLSRFFRRHWVIGKSHGI